MRVTASVQSAIDGAASMRAIVTAKIVRTMVGNMRQIAIVPNAAPMDEAALHAISRATIF